MTYGTMVKIDSITVTDAGGQSAMQFVNIPQTYTDLVIYISGRSTRTGSTADYGLISFNGSTSSFTGRQFSGAGTGNATSNTGARETGSFPATDATSSTFGNGVIYITDYKSSNNKSFSVENVSENNATTAYQVIGTQLWADSAAITSISLTLGNGPNWAQNSTATLYGVSRVSADVKAYGGMVIDDTNYYYHIFTDSSVFTPTQSLAIDAVILAGGGGGGGGASANGGGGGGAGGYQTYSGTLTANTAYTITVGGGGTAGNNSAGGNGSNTSAFSITSTGGGGGGAFGGAGQAGGSGGGGGRDAGTSSGGAASPAGQGFAGGASAGTSCSSAGGGGGAGAVGNNGIGDCSDPGIVTNANGGIGKNTQSSWWSAIAPSMTGITEWNSATYTGYIAGGGAGMRGGVNFALGGTGGGGNAQAGSNYAAQNGVANTGSGGGGSQHRTPGAGGKGIVVVRYAKQ